MGPRCSRASLGDLEYSLSSLRRRWVVDVEAIVYNRYIDVVVKVEYGVNKRDGEITEAPWVCVSWVPH